MKFTFFCFNKQSVLQQPGEHLMNMGYMFLNGLRKDENVVQIHKNEPVQKVMENIID